MSQLYYYPNFSWALSAALLKLIDTLFSKLYRAFIPSLIEIFPSYFDDLSEIKKANDELKHIYAG